jgi:DNA-binding GntR family transcriptional regulator
MDSDSKSPATLEAMVREKVRNDILSGGLEPNMRLRIRWLGERYGVGATPLREALSRLVPEGLISIEQNRGFRVASLSIPELVEITEMRQIVEAAAFRRAIQRGDDAWEAQIVAAFHRLSKLLCQPAADPCTHRLEWEARHRAFHMALLAACGNRRLLRAADQLYENLGRYRSVLQLNELPPERLTEVHKALMETALERDIERGARTLADHFELNIEQLEDNLRCDPALFDMIAPSPNGR